jgi:hypothetical protein
MSFSSAEPPSFISAPKAVTKAAVSQDVTIECEAFGSPDPEITWIRRREQNGNIDEVLPLGSKFRKNKKNHFTIMVS